VTHQTLPHQTLRDQSLRGQSFGGQHFQGKKCSTTAKGLSKDRPGAEASALHGAKCARYRKHYWQKSQEGINNACLERDQVRQEVEDLKKQQKQEWNDQNPGQATVKQAG